MKTFNILLLLLLLCGYFVFGLNHFKATKIGVKYKFVAIIV